MSGGGGGRAAARPGRDRDPARRADPARVRRQRLARAEDPDRLDQGADRDARGRRHGRPAGRARVPAAHARRGRRAGPARPGDPRPLAHRVGPGAHDASRPSPVGRPDRGRGRAAARPGRPRRGRARGRRAGRAAGRSAPTRPGSRARSSTWSTTRSSSRRRAGGSRCGPSGESDAELRVVVADTGVGVPAAELPRLFERFYKADRSRASSGTGLGLAIVKHVVQAHGGRVGAESRPGEGSTFWFTLPIATPATAPPRPASQSARMTAAPTAERAAGPLAARARRRRAPRAGSGAAPARCRPARRQVVEVAEPGSGRGSGRSG